MTFMIHNCICRITAVAGVFAMVTACQPSGSTGTVGTTTGNSASTVNFQDKCASFRQPFTDIKSERNKLFATNVIGGAVAGALIGKLTGKSDRDILAGAAIGGLTGYAAAYSQNLKQRGATEASLTTYLNRDAREEARKNDQLVNNLLLLNSCRLDQVDQLRQDLADKKTTPADAKKVAQHIAKLAAADNRLINDVSGNNRSYQAYIDILKERDTQATQETRNAVARYTPAVRTVKRTARGTPAVDVAPRPEPQTSVAAAEISRVRLDATAKAANTATLQAINGFIGDLDLATPV